MDIPEKYKRFVEPDPITRKKDLYDVWTTNRWRDVFWIKYYDRVIGLLIKSIGQEWDNVYSKICKFVPVEFRVFINSHIINNYVRKAKGKFYIENGILCFEKENSYKSKRVYPKPKKDPFPKDFKFDYVFEIYHYDFSTGDSWLKRYSERTRNKITIEFESGPSVFTIQQFIDWALKNNKTFKIRYYTEYSNWNKKLTQVITHLDEISKRRKDKRRKKPSKRRQAGPSNCFRLPSHLR